MWVHPGSNPTYGHFTSIRGSMRTTLWFSAFLVLASAGLAIAQTQEAANPATTIERTYVVPAGTVLRVTLSAPFKPTHLKPGSEVEGQLNRAIYSYDRQVIPAGARFHAVVGDVDKHRADQKKGLIEHLQTIRSFGLNRKYEYDVAFKSADIQPGSGAAIPLEVKFVQGGDVVELHTKGDQIEVGSTTGADYAKHAPGVGTIENIKHSKKQAQQYRHPELTLETERELSFFLPPDVPEPVPTDISELPAGSHARLLLLEPLSAADNKQGDTFHARVLEPVVKEGKLLLPEGAVLEGHIGRIVPPRRLNRAASLFLVFDKVQLKNGESEKVAASLVGTGMSEKDAGKIDEEGGLHGQGPGAKRMLKRFTVGLASQQIADEVAEMATHAAGPYVSIPLGLALFLGGHGHDVELPRYTELQVAFGRPMPIGQSGKPAAQPPAPLETAPQK